MTLQELEGRARKTHEAVIGAWTARPSGQTKLILDEYKKAYNDISRQLSSVYKNTLTGINPADAGYYNAMLKYNRLTNLQSQIAKSYTIAAKGAASAQFAVSEVAMSEIYYSNMFATSWFTPRGYFSTLDQKAVEVSVYGTPKIWEGIKESNRAKYSAYLPQYGTLSSRLSANAVKDLDRISSAVTQGLRQGLAYPSVSRDLRNIFNTTASNALRIARTEGNRALNAGAYANSMAAVDAGIDLQRQYMATQDTRTREQSGAMDGQRRPANKPFNYGGYSWFIPGNSGNPAYDINDRCTVIDIVDGQNPELRRGRNPVTGQTEVADFSSFDDWMEKNNLTRSKAGRIITT